jgi:hypothetical protein
MHPGHCVVTAEDEVNLIVIGEALWEVERDFKIAIDWSVLLDKIALGCQSRELSRKGAKNPQGKALVSADKKLSSTSIKQGAPDQTWDSQASHPALSPRYILPLDITKACGLSARNGWRDSLKSA